MIANECSKILRKYPDVLDVTQTSQILGVSAKLVYRMIKEGQIHAIKIGRVHRIPKTSLIHCLFPTRRTVSAFRWTCGNKSAMLSVGQQLNQRKQV